MYSEVRQHLRQQHTMNLQEVYGKRDGYRLHTDFMVNNDVQKQRMNHTFWTFSFKKKIFLFLGSVMLFSFYLYGEQNIERGAMMAWNDFQTQIDKMEQSSPVLEKVILSFKKGFQETKEVINLYINDENNND